MNKYISFFGSSHGFNSFIFDSNDITLEFKKSIEERGLLESAVFTTDDTQNKEILARYIFKADGKTYSLLKLYSFAQASNISRIDGCIFGVALISDGLVKISKLNLEILRAAKDNFAKLSLNGLKFNKTDFQEDVRRIWNAIVHSNTGNLLEKTEIEILEPNNNDSEPIAFCLNNLFFDSVNLNEKVLNYNNVYFSEDLEHLKRTQNKWGKDNFTIYWLQNNKFEKYKEPIVTALANNPNNQFLDRNKNTPIAMIKNSSGAMQSDSHNTNHQLKRELETIKDKQKLLIYILYFLVSLIVLLSIYLFFLKINENNASTQLSNIEVNKVKRNNNNLSNFLTDSTSIETGVSFFKAVNFIYSFKEQEQIIDSANLHKQFQILNNIAEKYNIQIDNVKDIYKYKSEKIKITPSAKKSSNYTLKKP